jgi:anti-sigma regulatory factor (Ser/Thr protein kinase)
VPTALQIPTILLDAGRRALNNLTLQRGISDSSNHLEKVMACHVLFVEVSAGSSSVLQAAHALGWRCTRLEEGALAHAWLRNSPPDLVLVGRELPDLPPGRFVRAVKLDHACNALPLVQLGNGPAAAELEVEPDAWLDPAHVRLLGAAAVHARAVCADRLRDGGRAEVRFTLPSERAEFEELNGLLGHWFTACGFGPHHVQQLVLAVRELGYNAIEWGHGNDPSRPLAVTCRLDAEKVSVLVRDTGPGFDPRDLPHAARHGDPLSHLPVRAAMRLREGGFGILMTRGLVDYLCYNDAGNEACLVKYLPARRHPRVEVLDVPLAASR